MCEFPCFCRVTADYESPYTAPFFLAAGAQVAVGRTDAEWPGWVWCTNAVGESRWVPESYLRCEGAAGWLRRDYDAVELSVRAGEGVTAVSQESGWLWCINQTGQSGWLPQSHLQIDP